MSSSQTPYFSIFPRSTLGAVQKWRQHSILRGRTPPPYLSATRPEWSHTLGFKPRPPILGRQLSPTPSPLPSGWRHCWMTPYCQPTSRRKSYNFLYKNTPGSIITTGLQNYWKKTHPSQNTGLVCTSAATQGGTSTSLSTRSPEST